MIAVRRSALPPARREPRDWRQDAACRDADPEIFFPAKRGSDELKAKRICRGCPVRVQCRAEAQRTGSVGIWAATSSNERNRAGRNRRPSAPDAPP